MITGQPEGLEGEHDWHGEEESQEQHDERSYPQINQAANDLARASSLVPGGNGSHHKIASPHEQCRPPIPSLPDRISAPSPRVRNLCDNANSTLFLPPTPR